MTAIIADLLEPGVGKEIQRCRKIFRIKQDTALCSIHWCEPIETFKFLHDALSALHGEEPDWYEKGAALFDEVLECLSSQCSPTPFSLLAFSLQNEKSQRTTRFLEILNHVENELVPQFYGANSHGDMLDTIRVIQGHFADLESKY